jgi:alpha-L-fucosidase
MVIKKPLLLIAAVAFLFPVLRDRAFAAEPAAERTPILAEWESLKYGMFIHYGMSTFAEGNWQTSPPAKAYAPTQLDVRQWIRVAKQAGMTYAVLTAKHVAGHCLWDSEDYDYDVAASSDRTDVVARFMSACKEEGIKPGLYYCILDNHNEGGVKWEAAVDAEYFGQIKAHLTELHARYPGICEQWIDIPRKLTPEQRQELYDLIKRLSPNCLVMMNQAFLDGQNVPLDCWPTDLANGEQTLPPPAGHNPVKIIQGKTYYIPMEVCDTICERWFWTPGDAPRSTKRLYRLFTKCRQRNANLLLNVTPGPTGKISQEVIDRLMDLKAAIENPALIPPPVSLTYDRPATASNVFQGSQTYGPAAAVDDDERSRWAADAGVKAAWLEVDLGEQMSFDRAIIQEAYARVRSFSIEIKEQGKWKTIFRGGTIGDSLSVSFQEANARFVRLNILEATDGPTIWEFQLLPPKVGRQ